MWYAFCYKCGEEIDLDVVFMHDADGKIYECPACHIRQIAEYDEDVDSGEGFVRMRDRRTSWVSPGVDPIADLEAMAEWMTSDTGIEFRRMKMDIVDFKAMLYRDCQQMYLMGATAEQVMGFARDCSGLYREYITNAKI
jgi:hypothetical protein